MRKIIYLDLTISKTRDRENRMTDRLNALTVILEDDVRDDDAQPLISAIYQLKGVISVKPHVSDIDSAIAETRAIHKFKDKIRSLLLEE